jgi:tRNA (guanine37-N1)-methyltransferase
LVNQKTAQQITLLDTFDEYESYLFFNSSSIDNKIDDAITYDSDNYNSLVYQLPEYVKDDSDSADYIKFTAMTGHFFDNILVFIKKFPKAYPISNNDSNYYPKNYIDELLNSFNWNIDIDKFSQSDLNQLYFNNQEISGYNSASYFDYTKSILNRFANNISSVYKSKGTINSFEMIRTMFGIPAGLISTREYGSADAFSNRDNYFVYDDIIYMTPDGDTFQQQMANQLSMKENLLLICGHYKGIDQRIRDLYVTREISVGDYVLSGGELAAAIVVDAIGRLIPGVLNDETSALFDSFQDNLLAPPVYTRPAEFKGLKVPDILLTGHPLRIEEWRNEQSLQRTKEKRPDILRD